MIIALIGWAALAIGVWSTILLGRRSRWGWFLSIISCTVWVIFNFAIGIWSGGISSSISLVLAYWNWRKWRDEPKAAVLRDSEGL